MELDQQWRAHSPSARVGGGRAAPPPQHAEWWIGMQPLWTAAPSPFLARQSAIRYGIAW